MMPNEILYVESRPVSPDRTDEYNRWYNDVHVPEVLALPDFVAAQRFAPVDDEGRFVAIYEIESDDPHSALASLGRAAADGTVQMSDVIQMDPPPRTRLLRVIPF